MKTLGQLFLEAGLWRNVRVPNEPRDVPPPTQQDQLKKFVMKWQTPDGKEMRRTFLAANQKEAELMAQQDYYKAIPGQYRTDYEGNVQQDKYGQKIPQHDINKEPTQGLSWWKRAWNKVAGKESPPFQVMNVSNANAVDDLLQNRSTGKGRMNDIDVQDMNNILKALVAGKIKGTAGRGYGKDQLRRMFDAVREYYNNKNTRYYFDGDGRIERENAMLVQKLVEKGWLQRKRGGFEKNAMPKPIEGD